MSGCSFLHPPLGLADVVIGWRFHVCTLLILSLEIPLCQSRAVREFSPPWRTGRESGNNCRLNLQYRVSCVISLKDFEKPINSASLRRKQKKTRRVGITTRRRSAHMLRCITAFYSLFRLNLHLDGWPQATTVSWKERLLCKGRRRKYGEILLLAREASGA